MLAPTLRPFTCLLRLLLVNQRADVSLPGRRLIVGKTVSFLKKHTYFLRRCDLIGRHAAAAAVMAPLLKGVTGADLEAPCC